MFIWLSFGNFWKYRENCNIVRDNKQKSANIEVYKIFEELIAQNLGF